MSQPLLGTGTGCVHAQTVARSIGAETVRIPETDFAQALLSGEIDAYAAWYDRIPVGLADGIVLSAVLPRAERGFASLPSRFDISDGEVGVCRSVLASVISEENPDLRVTVAEAGDLLEDLGSYDRIVVPACIAEGHAMDRDVYIHTPSQGAVAVFCRKGDEIQGIRSLNHMPTRTEVEAERGIMNLIGAVPDAPIGIDAEIECDCIRIRAVSRCYTDESRRVDEYIPIDYVMDEILGIAEFLAGRHDGLRQRLNTIPVIFDPWNAQRAMRIR